jgi:hypothetical protein
VQNKALLYEEEERKGSLTKGQVALMLVNRGKMMEEVLKSVKLLIQHPQLSVTELVETTMEEKEEEVESTRKEEGDKEDIFAFKEDLLNHAGSSKVTQPSVEAPILSPSSPSGPLPTTTPRSGSMGPPPPRVKRSKEDATPSGPTPAKVATFGTITRVQDCRNPIR